MIPSGLVLRMLLVEEHSGQSECIGILNKIAKNTHCQVWRFMKLNVSRSVMPLPELLSVEIKVL